MSYRKAEQILPEDLLELIQKYVDGECIYIPRKRGNKKEWGSRTSARKETALRNGQIYRDYRSGHASGYLAEKYFLSLKSIQRIVREEKEKDM